MENGVSAVVTAPRRVEDASGRRMDLRELRSGDRDALVEMYLDLDGRCRAMGIPPVTEPDLNSWLDSLEDGHNLVAWHEGRLVGHAVTIPDGDSSHELAVFVHQDYQNARVGTELVRTLLGDATEAGIDSVWLTVACGNASAKRLFRSVGFTVEERSRRQLTMRLDL